jgi:hypothetical protein
MTSVRVVAADPVEEREPLVRRTEECERRAARAQELRSRLAALRLRRRLELGRAVASLDREIDEHERTVAGDEAYVALHRRTPAFGSRPVA